MFTKQIHNKRPVIYLFHINKLLQVGFNNSLNFQFWYEKPPFCTINNATNQWMNHK